VDDENGNPVRGCIWGLLIAMVLWIVIIVIVWKAVN
jgi:hypothetical protein